jgi:hypothetical protein
MVNERGAVGVNENWQEKLKYLENPCFMPYHNTAGLEYAGFLLLQGCLLEVCHTFTDVSDRQ